jgi:hypothetical protein
VILSQTAFFTVDRGTATTAAALIGRLGDRWRLLAAGAVPASIDPDLLLGDLVVRTRAARPSLLSEEGDWRTWPRLESCTAPPPPIVLAASSERSLEPLEAILSDTGWRIAARLTPDRLDPIRATEALLDPQLHAVALAAAPGEQGALSDLAALVAAAVGRRPDVRLLLTGAAAVAATWFPPEAVVQLPDPRGAGEDRSAGGGQGGAADAGGNVLRDIAERLAGEAWSRGGAPPEGAAGGRANFRRAMSSLAAILDLRLEGLEVGASAGSRVLTGPGGPVRAVTRAEAALWPVSSRRNSQDEEELLDEVVSWSPLRDDGQTQRDRIRNLWLAPWRDVEGDGARLRLAAARAALARLETAWLSGTLAAATVGEQRTRRSGARSDSRPGSDTWREVALGAAPPDLLVASGGAFAVAPPPAVALALIDVIRRPGAVALALDHARALAPLGCLEDEAERRRLLADLADDLLLPLGGAILATGLRPGRKAHLRVEVDGVASQTTLLPGTVQVVDLPPGLLATVEIGGPDELWVGVRAKRVRFEMAGGPLRLPQHPERRREALEAWQRPLWTSVDGS